MENKVAGEQLAVEGSLLEVVRPVLELLGIPSPLERTGNASWPHLLRLFKEAGEEGNSGDVETGKEDLPDRIHHHHIHLYCHIQLYLCCIDISHILVAS